MTYALRWALNTPLVDFTIRVLILGICLGVVISIVNFIGMSELNQVGAPILFSLGVLCSQLILRYSQEQLKTSYTFLGLLLHSKGIRDFLSALAIVFIVSSCTLLLELLIGWVRFRGVAWNFVDQEQATSHISWLANILRLQLIAGFWEELLFRGYLIQTPNTKTKFIVSAIISSFLFGVLHYLVPPYASPPVALFNILVGLLFAYCYAQKGLWFTIGLHFAWNTLPSSLFGLLNPETSLVRLTNSVPNWLNASGTIIDPWLLLLMFSFCLGFTRGKEKSTLSSI